MLAVTWRPVPLTMPTGARTPHATDHVAFVLFPYLRSGQILMMVRRRCTTTRIAILAIRGMVAALQVHAADRAASGELTGKEFSMLVERLRRRTSCPDCVRWHCTGHHATPVYR